MGGCWVFGYGSLVSPVSFGSTLGRTLRPGRDFFEAEVRGFGRRWNYGVMHTEGATVAPDGAAQTWTIVALGVVASDAETVNGVVAWVEDHELVALDRRERHYDRIDVTPCAEVHGTDVVDGPIVTYRPRAAAVRHFEQARDAGRAAIERRYWDLVDGAFAALGEGRREQYHATTPRPDIPVLDLLRRPVG